MPRKSNPAAFKPGNPGGPGRPLGSRNRLTETALAALGADFAEHGPATIAKVRTEKPHVYLQVVASLLPRQLLVERVSPFSDLSDEELTELEIHLAASRARTVRELNGKAIEIKPSDKQET